MSTSEKDSDAVLERARVREVTGVFRSRLALDVAAGELLLMGFDRADIDVVAGIDEIYKKLGVPYVAPEELADVPRVPRRPLVVGEDVTVFTILIAGAIAAGATVYLMSFSDAGSAEIVVAAALVGIVAAGAGFLLAARIFRRDEARGLDALMAGRGLILWVRARSPEQEALAQEILLSHRAEAVRVHEIELEKRPEDLPLGTIRPDP
ncbi:MAG: hypothetical protein ACXU87_16385, partial [Xanthobacteraceae bacterium]